MHTLIVCLTILAALLIAAICAIVISSNTVPNGLYIALSSIVTGLIGVHVGTTVKS